MNKIKVMTVVGTRPEIIRLSRTMSLLDQFCNQIIVHTGQNYDYELNEVFWDDLELRKPDHFLEIDTSTMGSAVGDIIRKSETVMRQEKPDCLLVLGDTNSCLAAYVAKRLHIPIFHMEAGNRSYDFNVPEEVNRRVVDHVSDFNLVYTEHARRHLISEGLQHRRIYLTGSPMKEILTHYQTKIDQSKILRELKIDIKNYFLVSVHREENVDNPDNLRKILTILNNLGEKYQKPIIVSTHPRTRKRLELITDMTFNDHIFFMKPFGFLDYVHLQMKSLCVISDSGTISEESSILNFPAISLRQSMERPEAQDTASIILTGFEVDIVLSAVETVIAEQGQEGFEVEIPADYQIANTSWRVLKLILGNTKLSNKWWGIHN